MRGRERPHGQRLELVNQSLRILSKMLLVRKRRSSLKPMQTASDPIAPTSDLRKVMVLDHPTAC